MRIPVSIACLLVLFGADLHPARGQQPARKGAVTILPLPSREIPPPVIDAVLAGLARQIRSQYAVRVLSGRAVGRAVWGTLGSGLEECSMRFSSHVNDGKRAYQTLQIDKAIDSMQEARRQEEICGPEVRDVSLLTDLYLYLGLALLAEGKNDEAGDAFRQAVSYNSDLVLSKRKFPPDQVQAFNRAKRSLLSSGSTQIAVISKPAGATVVIDGNAKGTTPVSGLPLYPGRHFVRLELEGYSPWTLNLPDGIPPRQIKALMVPLWTGEAPEDLIATAIATEQMDEPVLAQLRLLAGFFRADAMVLVSVSKEGRNHHLGVRLFVVRPESVGRARLFNLGAEPDGFEQKIRGVVSTLKDMNNIEGARVAVAPVPPEPSGGGNNAFLPPSHGGSEPSGGGSPDGYGSGDSGTKWYKSWWFWTAVGVAVAAGTATGLALWLTQPEESWTLVVQPN